MNNNLTKAFYSLKDLKNLGYSYYKVKKLERSGTLTRISNKYYENNEYDQMISDLNYIPLFIDDGIICSLSASVYYGYTNYRPNSVDVAVQANTNLYTKPLYPSITLHYMSDYRKNIGVTIVTNEVGTFKIFTKERTVCDFIINHTKIDSEEIKNVIVGYLNDPERDLNRLSKMAKELKCFKLLQTYLEVLL